MPQHVLPPPSRPNPPPLLFPFWLLLPFHRYPTLSTLHLLVLLLSLSLSLSLFLSLFPLLSSSPGFLPHAPTTEYIYTPPRRGSTRPFIKTFPPREEQPHTSFPSAPPPLLFHPSLFLQLPRSFHCPEKRRAPANASRQHVHRWSFEYPRQRFAIRAK